MSNRIMWTEGLLLTPQHLQHWDTTAHSERWALLQACSGSGSGILELDIDLPSLQAGQVMVRRLVAVMPDGTLLDAPAQDEPPPTRTLPHQTNEPTIGLYVGVPAEVNEAPHVTEVRVSDVYGDHTVRSIQVARLTPRVYLQGERLEGLHTIKLAELRRDSSGLWALSATYVPPLLRLDGSAALVSLLKDLQVLLGVRRRGLMEKRAEATPTELSYGDMLSFWLLYSINGVSALLDHALEHGAIHPERLFTALRVCVGQMTVFGEGLGPKDLPNFRAEDLYGSYNRMIELIHRLLGAAIPVHHVAIPMRSQGPNHWLADLPRNQPLDRAELILMLTGVAPPDMAQEAIRDALKVSASSAIDFIVNGRLRGVELQLLARPPQGVPARRDTLYLRMVKREPFWPRVVESRELALYMPNALTSLKPELAIVP